MEKEVVMGESLVEQIDQMDKQFAQNMAEMSQNMEKLTSSIAGFSLLKSIMLQPPGPS